MEGIELLYVFLAGLGLSLVFTTIWSFLEKRSAIRKSKLEAKHWVQEAVDKNNEIFEDYKKQLQLKYEKKQNQFENEKEIFSKNIQALQSDRDNKKHELKIKQREQQNKAGKSLKNIQALKSQKQAILQQKKELKIKLKTQFLNYKEALKQQLSLDEEALKQDVKKELNQKWIKEIRNHIEEETKQNKENLQKNSLFYLNLVLNRFDRSYCPERGIPPVNFKSLKHIEKVVGKDNIYLNQIEKECGVDIVINKESLQALVFGIDPVRRELGRWVLKELSRFSKIKPAVLSKLVHSVKRKLFSKIRSDGRKMCKKLKLSYVSPEVQNMMGALRYRYSFAQNQYFHCEEVSWLCGLFNAELGLPLKKAQRSGLFHDIGKAMDHAVEGNHAVIGAEFISKHGESQDVVHAVRAHHYDEVPQSPLAYLVIVADSISGSRPGARRFTEDSYNQKMEILEQIIESFDNIKEAYIMSAGREMRVIVDSEKVSDALAIDLSRQIAAKVEKECSYPGLIKVTVVRHSVQTAMAKVAF